jgi:hypothetical protein
MSGTINEKRASSNGTRVMKRSVESLPQGDRPMVWYDERLAGFGVRAMPSGRRDYFARDQRLPSSLCAVDRWDYSA